MSSETIDFHGKNNDTATNENASTDVLYEVTDDILRKRIQEIRQDVLRYVNNRINNMMSDVQKIAVPLAQNEKFLHKMDKYHEKRKSSEKGVLPNKEFLERNSLLTDLFNISHIRTVYNIFMLSFTFFFLNSIACDIMESGTIRVGTNTLSIGFAKFPTFIFIWLFMQALTFGVYAAFTLWAYRRLQFLPKSFIRKLWDYSWILIFILYQIFFVISPTKAMLDVNFSICCKSIVLIEQVRMMMKSYAFVRSVAPRFLSYKPHSETSLPYCPKFSQYLYFLFAPTLVYRDEYPRTKRVRWIVVIQNLVEFGLSIFYLTFILESLVSPVYRVFGTQYLDWKWFVKNIIKSTIPGILNLVTVNYLLLHAWMNAWAETLQFADRLFYKDWWNSTTFHMFFRTWNVVVHDWLYTYIYKDMYEIVVPHNRVLSATTVFFISAIVHEYILGFAFGLFYPVLFIFYIKTIPVFFIRKTSNFLVLLLLTFVFGTCVNLYAIEFYARQNCPPHPNYYRDLFVPRSWSCNEQFIA